MKLTFRCELEHRPAPIAEANCADLLKSQVLLQGVGATKDLRAPNVLAMTSKKSVQIEGGALVWVLHRLWLY